MIAALPPAAGGLCIVISGSGMPDGVKGLLYSVVLTACALALFTGVSWTSSLRGREDLVSWTGLGTMLAGAFVVGFGVLAVNQHKLAVSGRTEQVTVTSVTSELHEAGSEDNPVDYFTYNYRVTDPRGARVNGEIHTGQPRQEFRIGQRIIATVDPHGRLDPILGRPSGVGIYLWLAVAAEAAVVGLVIKDAFPDAEERSQRAWEAALRSLGH